MSRASSDDPSAQEAGFGDPFADPDGLGDPFADADDLGDPFAKREDLSDPFATRPLPASKTPVDRVARLRARSRSVGSGWGARAPVSGASAAAAETSGGRHLREKPPERPRRETSYVPTALVVVGGLIAAVTIYLAFVEIRPLSVDPLGNALVFFALCTAGLVLVTVSVAVAIRGAVVSRPRHRPLLTIVLGLGLVPLLVLGAGSLGLNAAKASFQDAAASDLGQAFVVVLELLEDQGVELGPFGTLTD